MLVRVGWRANNITAVYRGHKTVGCAVARGGTHRAAALNSAHSVIKVPRFRRRPFK